MKLLVIATILLSSFSAFSKGNRDDGEKIFNEAQKSVEVQVVFGFLEAYGAEVLLKSFNQSSELTNAEKRLRRANNLLTLDEKQEQLDQIGKKIEMMDEFNPKKNQAIMDNLSNEIRIIASRSAVTTVEKERLIKEATRNLNRIRANLIKESKLTKSIKAMKIVGGSLLILDVLGRVYVWNSLEADPTFTPVGTFLYKSAKEALSSEE